QLSTRPFTNHKHSGNKTEIPYGIETPLVRMRGMDGPPLGQGRTAWLSAGRLMAAPRDEPQSQG
ncbi:MAG: hypothetical protein KC643_25790, partial [Nitrospira sp.]|nr:hypothetical protein [Nitrospira sp.]